jgi:ABC-type Mn2+/Zn2+ transport system ATPase subunit
MSTALIDLAGVSLGDRGAPVLTAVSFTIARGEFVALVGPNGAGKTTLLRGMLGLVPVRTGRRQRQLATLCLEDVGLAALAKRQFWEFSGGQKQRVLIARPLAAEPEELFLYEPTAGVDHAAAATIIELLGRLVASLFVGARRALLNWRSP